MQIRCKSDVIPIRRIGAAAGHDRTVRYLSAMRAVLASAFALLCVQPAAAWEATIGVVCTLDHADDRAEVRLTYDPRIPEYSITIKRLDGAWPAAPVFALRFEGAQGLTISTDRHTLSEGATALTVRDRGFGNVLNGLQFNSQAVAVTGDAALPISLDGAAPAVAAFRRCDAAPSV